MKLAKVLLIVCLSVTGEWLSHGQVAPSDLQAHIYFQLGNSKVDTIFHENGGTLSGLIQSLNTISLDSGYMIDEVRIIGMASPDEKRASVNTRLAQRRAKAVRKILLSHVSIPENRIVIENQGENWAGIRALVDTSSIPYKEEVLTILDSVADRNARKNQLMVLGGGEPYLYMKTHFFPSLRNCVAVTSSYRVNQYYRMKQWAILQKELCSITLSDSDKDALIYLFSNVSDSDDALHQVATLMNGSTFNSLRYRVHSETAALIDSLSAPDSLRIPYRWALKTNLLYDALMIPNIELEYRFAPRWSVNTEIQYTWFSRPQKNIYYQIAAAGIECKYWVNRSNPYYGHSVGLYYYGGLYDLENRRTGYQGECHLSMGLSYGYLMPINKHFSLDFGLGLGYLTTIYKKYSPIDGRNVYLSTDRLNYFGPTKAKVGLVWKWNND